VSYGRDPRRRPTIDDRRYAYERADGRCQNCGRDLGADYHNAHLAAWTHGGATNPANIEAWCADCNLGLGATDVEQVGELTLRQWQAQALPVILRRLWQTGYATLHAAPGAGKTLFGGAVFQQLHNVGLAGRLLVVVPNLAIVEQWREALSGMRIHLDTQPRDGVIEHPDTVGAVVTYHILPNSAAAQATRMERVPTLVILDEVHHVAESKAWGTAVRRMIGDVTNGTVHPAAVLNMTGTLFRSGKEKRITTVRYDRVMTDAGEKLQAVADWSIPTADLVGVELRGPDLYVYGGRAELVDLRDERVVSGEIADLDQQQRATVVRQALTSKTWLKGFVTEAIRMLQNQLQAINGEEPLKLLFVASNKVSARLAADAINAVTGEDFARLVISDEPQALRTLRKATKEPRPCAIVAVQMITEGFDCPQVSTIAYAANKTADLFVAQTMARAMRVTKTERANGRMLPAQILIPDHPELRRAFVAALANALHQIEDGEDTTETNPRDDGDARLPRYELLELSDPRLDSATVLGHEDGEVPAAELDLYLTECRGIGIPETYAPRVAVVSRRRRPPLRTYTTPEPEASTVVTVEADPRTLNLAHRAQLEKAAAWMSFHVRHDDRWATVGAFQAQANDAASPRIPNGGRDHATTEQLAACAEWMRARVVEHCQAHKEWVPSWANGEDQ
jgi:superfamily II DNA or RNA helicase